MTYSHEKETAQGNTSRVAASCLLAALVAGLVALMLVWTSDTAHAASTFTVNRASDFNGDVNPGDGVCDADFAPGGPCTLRAAIEEANRHDGADAIHFDIQGTGVQTIRPLSRLPFISETVTIDGYTQPGAQPNTLAKGTDAKVMIELDGSGTAPGSEGLILGSASGSVIRGLAINRFPDVGIETFPGDTNITIEGNFIGTDPSGTLDEGNGFHGVLLRGASDSVVGGTSPASRNLISGNQGAGVLVALDAGGNEVEGNLIGTNKDGTSAMGNSGDGVLLETGADASRIGGNTAASSNTIAYNGGNGVEIRDDGLVTDPPPGVTSGNAVLRNSVFSNAGIGIDLAADGSTPNDALDADVGPNGLQNKPVLTSAKSSDSATIVEGRLSSAPNETYVVRFFKNPADTNEGKTFIGQKTVATSADGLRSFAFSPAKTVSVGQAITATATDAEGNTSEYSAPRKVVRR